ncbi:UvrB/UvrC motif-containing protein [Patescibacteria group bacterium]|nr:UvrB/UvrC motif-containing protein [Patescibacteria group bacterium]
MIPASVKIKNGELPDAPGVYFHRDAEGKLLYVGKATSLKKRVSSYFLKAHNARIAELVSKIRQIDYIQTPTVIEALVLEANEIRKNKPQYNVLLKDDKSFLYLCLSNEEYPRPMLLRGLDLERIGVQPFSKTLSPVAKRYFIAVYGPYVSGRALKTALDLLRRAMPWSVCTPPGEKSNNALLAFTRAQKGFGFRAGRGDGKPCFDAQIGKCPGVCMGAITSKEYRLHIRRLMAFFDGHKDEIIKELAKDMKAASQAQDFELAAKARDKIFSLEHIKDVALIMRDDDPLHVSAVPEGKINALGRIEAYDIANISGTANVAAMVVFEGGKPAKDQYRKFKIKTFSGADDFAAMEEVMRRRLRRFELTPNAWPLPDVFIIDGGEGQVNRVKEVMQEKKIKVPVIGIAKGFDRKQDRLVYDAGDEEVRRIAETFKETFQKARDEAHRFAGAYHRIVRGRLSGIPARKRKATTP